MKKSYEPTTEETIEFMEKRKEKQKKQKKPRRCLKCNVKFDSEGINNRLCILCSQRSAGMAGLEQKLWH